MNTKQIQSNVPLSFTQVVDIVGQLSSIEKRRLSKLLNDRNLDEMYISDEHKQIVLERIEKYKNKPDSYLSWDDIEHKLAARK